MLRVLRASFVINGLLVTALAGVCQAHFPWLATDDDGRALLFFGEGLDDRQYKLPEAVAAAEVFARRDGDERAALELETIEDDDFIGRRSLKPVPNDAVLESTCEYGLYHGMLLTYYSKYLPSDPAKWSELAPSPNQALDI